MINILNLQKLLEDNKAQFETCLKLLIKWNKTYNLTAIKEPKDIWERHFLDSITPLEFIPKNSEILDIGTGGGFPGIPLKIISPTLKITLIDSVQKKCNFCNAVIRELGLNNINVLCDRVENNNILKDKFDIIISRATFPLNKLIKYSANYLKNNNSVIISLKGENINKELVSAGEILNQLNLKLLIKENYTLPISKLNRAIYIFGK